jgi:bifunctional DNase/RNase
VASYTTRVLFLGVLALGSTGCGREKPPGDKQPKPVTAPRAAAQSPPAPEAPERPASAAPDARVSVPDGFIEMTVGGVAPTAQGNAVLLIDGEKKLGIPIFIGEAEALSIQLRLEKRRYDRPLTHDLLDSMMGKLGGRVESVRVDKVQDNVYFGTVIVATGARRIELDSRSSDAVALAVGNSAPIFVARQVVERSAVGLEQLESHSNSADEPEVRVEEPKRPAFTL